MNLPRWLVIVGIAIIALGLVLCGVGVGREIAESGPTPTPPTPTPTPMKSLDIIPTGAVRAGDITLAPLGFGSACTRTGTTITVTTGCRLTVQPGLFPLELRMVVTSGAARFEVAQDVRGDPTKESSAPDPTFRASSPTPGPTATPQVKIKVSRSEVEVRVACATSQCALRVIE